MNQKLAGTILVTLVAGPFGMGDPVVDLVPREKLGFQGKIEFQDIQWDDDCEWFGRKVVVHKAEAEIAASSDFLAPLAKQLDFVESTRRDDLAVDNRMEFVMRYEGAPAPEGASIFYWRGNLLFYPQRRELRVSRRGLWKVPTDEFSQPKIETPPDRQTCYADALNHLGRLGLRNGELYSEKAADDSPSAVFGEKRRGWYERGELSKPRTVVYELYVIFYQKIGTLKATGWGLGGKIRFTYAHSNRQKEVEYALRKWDPMAKFEVLDKAELEEAMSSGFAFGVEQPVLKCKRLKVTKVELLAACMPPDENQRHATPLYSLRVVPEGGPRDGEEEVLFIPALRIHRHAYDQPAPKANAPASGK